MMPHLAKSAGRRSAMKASRRKRWPEVEPELLRIDTITLPVQVNGKRRGELTIAADAPTLP
jgi:leucyl-tRNA synthetase